MNHCDKLVGQGYLLNIHLPGTVSSLVENRLQLIVWLVPLPLATQGSPVRLKIKVQIQSEINKLFFTMSVGDHW